MAVSWRISLMCGVVLAVINLCEPEIHRAKVIAKKSFASTSGGRFPNNPHSHLNEDEAFDKDIVNTTGGHSKETWVYSIISAILVGLSGIFPLVVIPLEAGKALRKGVAAQRLKLLLSFAVGGLLGDVFLHLLPEAWQHIDHGNPYAHMQLGLWVLTGLLSFLVVEKIFPDGKEEDEDLDEEEESSEITKVSDWTQIATSEISLNNNKKHTQKQSKSKSKRGHRKKADKPDSSPKQQAGAKCHVNTNGSVHPSANGSTDPGHYNSKDTAIDSKQNSVHIANGHAAKQTLENQQLNCHIKTSGWLNLLANVIDNFTHGLAVAGSYCVSTKSGMVTTVIILLHEIPHEMGDFAILLKSGFNRWKAAQAQLLTATGGVLGALTALIAESAQEAGNKTAWILPFTSGGFIYVSLVTVVPDLLKETSALESIKQVIFMLMGIFAMAAVALWFDECNIPTVQWVDSLIAQLPL